VIEVHDKETREALGTISEEDLQALMDHLEEQTSKDQDYYISQDTIEMLVDFEAPASLIAFLRRALGDREGIEIVWFQRLEDEAQ
jgi:hypothetical protein